MVRISVSPAAYEAIASGLALDATILLSERDPSGQYLILLERRVVDQLGALRGPGEDYSDVILRLFA